MPRHRPADYVKRHKAAQRAKARLKKPRPGMDRRHPEIKAEKRKKEEEAAAAAAAAEPQPSEEYLDIGEDVGKPEDEDPGYLITPTSLTSRLNPVPRPENGGNTERVAGGRNNPNSVNRKEEETEVSVPDPAPAEQAVVAPSI